MMQSKQEMHISSKLCHRILSTLLWQLMASAGLGVLISKLLAWWHFGFSRVFYAGRLESKLAAHSIAAAIYGSLSYINPQLGDGKEAIACQTSVRRASKNRNQVCCCVAAVSLLPLLTSAQISRCLLQKVWWADSNWKKL